MARVVPVGDLAEPGQPGPFSLARREHLVAVLRDAGWSDVEVEEVSMPIPLGGEYALDDVVAHVVASSLGRSVLGGVDETTKARALDEVQEALAPFLTDEGVVLPSAAWLVRASARTSRR